MGRYGDMTSPFGAATLQSVGEQYEFVSLQKPVHVHTVCLKFNVEVSETNISDFGLSNTNNRCQLSYRYGFISMIHYEPFSNDAADGKVI